MHGSWNQQTNRASQRHPNRAIKPKCVTGNRIYTVGCDHELGMQLPAAGARE
jgi:hypothetical protein